ncbi:hypothetical protein Pcinc_022242 [Petrolisthes cinctipes]|uniref:F-box protein n=1 Tax=Petrolisthes cinctipes TaxID=88211 RepID=A0AAE1KG95_PETCI|nr:hypothetical protein Pcinc_022242 [Petrolisthes cinctipes]
MNSGHGILASVIIYNTIIRIHSYLLEFRSFGTNSKYTYTFQRVGLHVDNSCCRILFNIDVAYLPLELSMMPPVKPVTRLEKLCIKKITDHLFLLFSSWYKSKKHTTYIQNPEECSEVKPKDVICSSENESKLSSSVDEEMEVDGNDNKGYWYMKFLTEGMQSFDDDVMTDNDTPASRTGALSPIPSQHQTHDSVTQWLITQLRDYLSLYLAPRFNDDILASLINMTACRVSIPRSRDKVRSFEEDLNFLNLLGFLLRVILSCFLMKGIVSLDFSTVSHLVKKWKLLCWGGETVTLDDESCMSPYFDIFSYALDITLPGLRTLKSLKLPHFVHDSFVRKVAFLCPDLQVLILRCTADCTSPKHTAPVVTNLDILCGDAHVCPNGQVLHVLGCKNLVTLALPEGVDRMDISSEAIEMLSYMPNLQHLVGAPMIHVAEEFEDIFDKSHECFKLTNFHHGVYGKSNWPFFVYDEALQDPNAEYLSQVFSNVKEVGIYAPTEVTEKVLMSFPSAQDITIFTDDFEVHGKYLRNLTTLDINVGYQMEWPILTNISHSSPSLEHLTLRSFSLQMTDYVDDRPHFPSLQTLKFHGQNVLEGTALLTVLHGCPVLSTIVISMITDEHGLSLLDDTTFQEAIPLLSHIQKFVYKVQSVLRTTEDIPSSLTIHSCKTLISSCPNLMYIGNLETWKISKVDIEELQEDAKRRNWDLEIQ